MDLSGQTLNWNTAKRGKMHGKQDQSETVTGLIFIA